MLNLDYLVYISLIKPNKNKVITKRLTNEEKSAYKFEGYLREILIGNLLGYYHMRKSSILINSRSNDRAWFLQQV
jgi:hypothetical protein